MPVFSSPLPTVDAALVREMAYALHTAAGVIMGGRKHDVLRDVMHTVVPYSPVPWSRPSATRDGGRTVRIVIGQIPMGRVHDVLALLEELIRRPVLSCVLLPNPKAPHAPSTACVVMVRCDDAVAFASLNQRVLMTTEGAVLVSPSDSPRFLQQLRDRDRDLEAFIRARFSHLLNKGRVRKAGQPLTVEVRGLHVYRWNPYGGSEAKTFLTAAGVRF